jgi:putative endonuclease
MTYCVYILHSSKLDRYYIGFTENLEKRISQHNNPIDPEKFTARGIPWDLFLSIECQSIGQAMELEKLIKSKKGAVYIRNMKLYPELIEKLLKQTAG